jgi:hypothetical protein
MLTELRGKGGRICQEARSGKLHCPLVIRPTSEDAITGNLFGTLGVLNPRWWLPDLLNEALGYPRFRRQVFRKLSIQLWRTRPCYPRELLPWPEGATEVDVTISWENPPTTVYIEMKYGSAVSPKGSGDNGQHGYPSDQLIRNARVGLHECGYFSGPTLFPIPPRDFVLLLVSPGSDHFLVKKYRKSKNLLSAIPHSDRLSGLPREPFIGQLSYCQIRRLLASQRRWFTRPERLLIDQLSDYLQWKEYYLPTSSLNGNGWTNLFPKEKYEKLS